MTANEYPYLTVRGKTEIKFEETSTPRVVDNILEHRKKLRQSYANNRMYKIPFMKEKKKKTREEAPLEAIK